MSKEDLQQKVLQELRARQIKLWEPPFNDGRKDDATDKSKTRNANAIDTLATNLVESSLSNYTKQDIVDALLYWQAHALEKLQTKQKKSVSRLELKILGLDRDVPQDTITGTSTWAERVEFAPKSITLVNVNSKLTISTFVKELETFLKATSVRLSHKGKSFDTDKDIRLVETVLQSCKTCKSGGVSTALLVQVTSQETSQSDLSPEQASIDAIRRAASKLATTSDFEVTDQNGKLVAISRNDRHSFLLALGIARLGQVQVQEGNYESALSYLLEADKEWNSISPEWRNRVDNYGLLQLDIAWIHLKLEHLEHLQDATRRLHKAERVLLKQVHSNFVTLAYTMADLGKQVPPLAAVFCRLYLLQGVAFHYTGNRETAKEKLDWAYSVCSSLRAVSSPEAISSLCEAMPGITQFQAISALRRTNGNPDQAIGILEQDEQNAFREEETRREQRKLGLCQDTMQYVNPDLISKLQNVLDIPSPQNVASLNPQEEDMTVVGLLRLCNNNLEEAIDLYQDVERNSQAVLEKVSQLDDALAKQGLETPRKGTKRTHDSIAVDDVALATLVSMHVNEEDAKRALQASNNNVDASLVWLTRKDDESTAQDARGTSNDNPDEDAHESNAAILKQKQLELDEAMNLLTRELGAALSYCDIEQQYLGSSLDEEWEYLVKFVGKEGK